MLRFVAGRIGSAVRGVVAVPRTSAAIGVTSTRNSSHGPEETDEEFDTRMENYFNRKDIDSWEIRTAMNDLAGMDLVPEPRIVSAALKACRRLNDYALAVRFLEVVRYKGGDQAHVIWPYIVQEIRPTLDELGILTPEEMGYDKPELALISPYEV
ncbi:GSCOCG00001770001-RA-CDS [Cotesia congregata]|uniref:Cytochrome c oxidase subunit 5A, mitochondrial n=1 Tax=Cotesia congregata TaxID=51543 RepID=A0A8J2HQT4_COTCN|nr:GSCOCG00001770001-RA-CDS [Cotesia congregata]CAG5107184.1 Similar to COX5A: Cytochrome c oxidase subunit 5A [Cotesia congregata]